MFGFGGTHFFGTHPINLKYIHDLGVTGLRPLAAGVNKQLDKIMYLRLERIIPQKP